MPDIDFTINKINSRDRFNRDGSVKVGWDEAHAGNNPHNWPRPGESIQDCLARRSGVLQPPIEPKRIK